MDKNDSKYVYKDEEFQVTEKYYNKFAAGFEKANGRKPTEEDLLAHLRNKSDVYRRIFIWGPPALVILIACALFRSGASSFSEMGAAELGLIILMTAGFLLLAGLFSLLIHCISHPDLEVRKRAGLPLKKAPVYLGASLLLNVLASFMATAEMFPAGMIACGASFVFDAIYLRKLLSALKSTGK